MSNNGLVKTGQTDEYLRRNRLVANAAGANANTKVAIARLEKKARTPKWLLTTLKGIEERTAPLSKELAAYRDELKEEE